MTFLSIFTECYSDNTGSPSSYNKSRRPSATPLLSKSSLPDMRRESKTPLAKSKLSKFCLSRFCMKTNSSEYGITLDCGNNLDKVREKMREVTFDEVIHQGFKGALGSPRPVTVQCTLTPVLVR
ncbi:hypothetical protein K7432_012146 [Basidiobolus ranarum]|uniref:Uncharacterized protein n=1 Tax=Basidiobolus ranarum TaxID=34480 RepID=A0ABR2VSQ2_9FUNG